MINVIYRYLSHEVGSAKACDYECSSRCMHTSNGLDCSTINLTLIGSAIAIIIIHKYIKNLYIIILYLAFTVFHLISLYILEYNYYCDIIVPAL